MRKMKQQRSLRDRSPFFSIKTETEKSVVLRSFDFWGSMKHKHSRDSDICFPPRNSLYSLLYGWTSPSAGLRNFVLVGAECVEENDLCEDIKKNP
ncbi:hypothetical protein CDAR_316811 [Caerostris darwini]|uniref:Uncharacterized protein n=1 Tax=Caerostris darwini TaxID=1538125 RepID=A0AAV4V970_9ARAC|nr:hypothetical protein CDAR_316811 [Caerostris darwini]